MGRGDGPGEDRVKGGASRTNTRAHTPYSDPVTRVSLALKAGQCWGLGLGPLHPRLLLPDFGMSRTPLPQLTPREPPLLRAHTLWRARTHLGHSHSASRDTRPRTCPPFTHAHARVHTQTHTASWPLPHSLRPPPPPARSPAKALIDCDTPTLIHRHTHSPHTCQPQTHIHKQGQEKYTRTPSPTLSGALSHSCPFSGLPISLCAGTQARLQNSLSAVSTCAGPSPRAPFPTVCPQTLSR